MTVYTGAVSWGEFLAIPSNYFSAAVTPEPGLYEDRELALAPNGDQGSKIDVLWTGFRRSLTGHRELTYFGDWYYRILIIPGEIDFGNVLTGKTADFVLWNGFLQDKTMTVFTPPDGEGLSITEPVSPSYDIAPLDEIEYTVTVGISGPPSISDEVSWTIGGLNYSVAISGQRVVVWPFEPLHDHDDVFSWKTDIITTKTREQRFSTRPIPWRTLSHQYNLTKQELSRALHMADEWSYRVFGVPIRSEGAVVPTIPAGSNSISINTQYSDFRDGGLALIWKSSSEYESVEIDTVNPDSLDLTLPVTGSYLNAKVSPLRLGLAESGIQFSRRPGPITSCDVSFIMTDGIDLSGTSPYPQYRSYDVMNDCRSVSGAIQESVEHIYEELSSANALERILIEDDARFTQQLTWLCESQQDKWQLVQWLHSIRGRQRPFWLPTRNQDFLPVATIASGSLNITVENTGFSLYRSTADIMIKLKDGTEFYRRITGASESGGNEVLSINTELLQDVAPNEIAFMCMLTLVRLNVDRIGFAFSNKHYRVSVPCVTVNQNE